MEALPPDPVVSPLERIRDTFKKRCQKDCAESFVISSVPPRTADFEEASNSLNVVNSGLPVHRNRPFTKGSRKLTGSARFAGRQRRPPSLRPRVLVVDDVNDVTEMIALFLKHAGYEVSTADSAATALQLAGERSFSVVISDIGMPEMNGYELAGALRALSEYQDIPMIAVTGYSEYDDRGRALLAGFNAHLTKPIDPSRLLDLMKELLDRFSH